mmetsp:Transcript_23468/g.65900  ORF Transcript_23468/g.65900 Transcript_23468/m.65900 type:complete len:157 (-) Transcript_23468:243-713(-)
MDAWEKDGVLYRALDRGDYERGHTNVLRDLTVVGEYSGEEWRDRFDEMKRTGTYHIVVAEDRHTGDVIGTGTLVVELKFIRGRGKCGHIEDIVVASRHQGRHIGKELIRALVETGQRLGCYKLVLDCSDENIPFYERCGFSRKEVQMVLYYPRVKL